MSDFADFHIDGPFGQDKRLTFFGTELSLSGWCVLPNHEFRLAVYARDLLLGSIVPAEARTDLRQAFPWLAPDATPGFNTTVTLPPGLTQANPDLRIRVALEHNGKPVKEASWGVGQGIPRLEFNIDEAKILDGRIVCDPRNTRFYGWAVCQEMIVGISADLGDAHRMTAQYGITRPDVFAVRPNNPNAANTGFSLFIPVLPPGCESILFSIQLASGTVLTRRFDLAVQVETVTLPSFRRLSFAEAHFRTRQANPNTTRPCFVLLPRSEIHDTPEPAAFGEDLVASLASIRACASQDMAATILVHADCETPPGETQPGKTPPAGIRNFRSGAELARALAGHADEWIVCLREGDTLSPHLDLFLRDPELAEKTFVYWDETALSDRLVRSVYKVPGAPCITLLHQNLVGRGWAARIDAALLEAVAGGDVAHAMLALPLAAFQTPAVCAHIPEFLSRHIYDSDNRQLVAADIAARNRVLADIETVYGAVSMTRNGELALACADTDLPRVSVIIPTIGTAARIIACLRGLREQTDYPDLEIIVIDHMPFAPAFQAMKRQIRGYADRVLSMVGPFNWSRFNNLGAALATGDVFLFLNDDIEMSDPRWLRLLLPYLSLRPVGAVGPRLLTPQGSVQSCGVSLFDGIGAARNDYAFTAADTAIGDGINLLPRNCTSLLGAAILTRRDTFTEVEGFEEALPLTFNDLDYHMKLRDRGQLVGVIATASLIHFEKTSRALIEEKPLEDVYDRKWRRHHLLGDPYIHPACETESGMYKIHREPGEMLWNRDITALREDVRRILVVRLDHIGDFTLTVPAFRLLRETFPLARIDAVVGPWNVGLAQRLQVFDQVLSFNFYSERSGDGRELDEAASRQQFRELTAGQTYDLAIDMRLDGDTRQLLTLVDARFRAGFSEGLLHPWLDISLEWPGNLRSWRKNSSVANDMRRLVLAVGDRFPTLALLDENHWKPEARTDADPAAVRTDGRPQVILHPFAGNDIKMWPAEKWRDLVTMLHQDGVSLLLIGSAKDAIREAETVASLTAAGAVSALGVYSLDELLGIMAAADCFVGCDSGPKHLAASAGIPVVALQSGFVDPVMWSPMNISGVSLIRNVHCAPCYIDDAAKCPRQVACMTQIAVADVYRQVSRALASAERPRSVDPATIVQPACDSGSEEPAGSPEAVVQVPRATTTCLRSKSAASAADRQRAVVPPHSNGARRPPACGRNPPRLRPTASAPSCRRILTTQACNPPAHTDGAPRPAAARQPHRVGCVRPRLVPANLSADCRPTRLHGRRCRAGFLPAAWAGERPLPQSVFR